MGRRNADVVRALIAAYNRRDIDAVVALFDPAVEISFDGLPELPQGALLRGHAGVRELIALMLAPWDELRTEIDELIDPGEAIVTIVRNVGRGKGSGVALEHQRGSVYDLRDGRIARARLYMDPDQARAAAGLDSKQAHS